MGTDPAEVEVLVGLDVGKGAHHATVLDGDGQLLAARAVANDQAALEGPGPLPLPPILRNSDHHS